VPACVCRKTGQIHLSNSWNCDSVLSSVPGVMRTRIL
jgi:hypothetical protein